MDAANRLNRTQPGSLPESSDTEAAPNAEQKPQATPQPSLGVLARLSGASLPSSAPRAVPAVRAGDPSAGTPRPGQTPANASHAGAVPGITTPDNPPDPKAQLEGFGFTPAQIEAMNRFDGALSMACTVWPTISKRNTLAGNSHELVARVASERGRNGLEELLTIAEDPLHQHYFAEMVEQLGIGSRQDNSWTQWRPDNGRV